MEERITKLEQTVAEIQKRNSRVEADKAWETSWTRILSLTGITYLVATTVLYLIGVERYIVGALVPAAGYYLSMRTLPLVKSWWIRRRRHS